MITLEHFDEVDMRVGTITAVSIEKSEPFIYNRRCQFFVPDACKKVGDRSGRLKNWQYRSWRKLCQHYFLILMEQF